MQVLKIQRMGAAGRGFGASLTKMGPKEILYAWILQLAATNFHHRMHLAW